MLVEGMGDRKKKERKGGGRKDRRNYKRERRKASPGRTFLYTILGKGPRSDGRY